MTARIGGIGSALGPVLKPIGFMSNSPGVARYSSRRCNDDHQHVHLMGGRAAGAAVYPPELCRAICAGIAEQFNEDKRGRVQTLPMNAKSLLSINMACCQATGNPRYVERDDGRGLSGMQMEAAAQGEVRNEFRMPRPAGVTRLRGSWPEHWADDIHEYDGHGIDAAGDDRTGEDILSRELLSLYVENGVEAKSTNVCGTYC